MILIDPITGEEAHRCDSATRNWFRAHPGIDTTLAACPRCGLLYKTGLKHLHECDDLIDPYTGALLHPGAPEHCPGNGEHPKYECGCDNCNYFLECHPEYDRH